MHGTDIFPAAHDHVFLGAAHDRNARRTWLVIGLTASMMVVEIVAGTVFGSMALLADGWHMSTHAAALSITALAYHYARRHATDRRFSFGTGKVGDLAGFASAVVLALVALLIGWESLVRLATPVPISFSQAMAVAAIGLVVNLLCAWILKEDHAHHHRHDAHHDPDHRNGAAHDPARDNNLRGAYLHVLADALTSVLALAALAAGSVYGWIWLDPLIGLVGAAVITRWSWGLAREAGGVLLDFTSDDAKLPEQIRSAVGTEAARVEDLHVWQVGPGHYAAIVAVHDTAGRSVGDYKSKLAAIPGLAHVTVELA